MGQLPREASEDVFGPPLEPVEVRCLHCGRRFVSSEMVWDRRGADWGPEFWHCPTQGCAGAGFGFDIFPVAEVDVSEALARERVYPLVSPGDHGVA